MEHVIWNPQMECADREEIEKIQLERLKKTVEVCYENVPQYKKKFDEIGLKPEHIKELSDIRLLPFTTKDDLRENYPYGMFAVPMKQIVRLHASSGTTGIPTVVGYTKGDIKTWSEITARVICAAGANDEDIAQISFGYGLFTGAFGLHYGMEEMGATVIPISGGNTERQIKIMQEFKPTLLISTPSYALYLAETAKKMGVDLATDSSLRIGLFGGEGHTVEMNKKISDALGILATENYGLSEICGPGYSGECFAKQGMHIAWDHFISEIIDPKTGQPLPEGEAGELIITPITKEGLPILRYRTKDITTLTYEKCTCGRTSVRMTKVQGRTDDMLIIRGVNVFPSQIEGILMSMEEVGAHYEIVLTTENFLDKIEVLVEVSEKYLDKFSNLEQLSAKIVHKLYTILNIKAKVTLVEPESLKRFEGKAQRITDLRNKTF